MGIKGFTKWITTNFSLALLTKVNTKCLLIDLNFILHYHAPHVSSIDELFKDIKKHIFILINKINPDVLVIVMDGIPPKAKEKTREARIINSLKYSKNKVIDFSNENTINNIKLEFINFADNIKNIFNIKPITLFNDIDEGELKIFKYIDNTSYKSYCIVSNDADVILLSLMRNKFIYIMNFRNHNSYFINTLSLKCLLMKHFDFPYYFDYDFPFICMLIGNDYLPKLKYISENMIYNAYHKFSKLKNPLINMLSTKLILENFYTFLGFLINEMKSYNRTSLSSINNEESGIYIKGLQWCIQSYINSSCIDIEFKCDVPPQHPLNLMIYMKKLKFYTI